MGLFCAKFALNEFLFDRLLWEKGEKTITLCIKSGPNGDVRAVWSARLLEIVVAVEHVRDELGHESHVSVVAEDGLLH